MKTELLKMVQEIEDRRLIVILIYFIKGYLDAKKDAAD